MFLSPLQNIISMELFLPAVAPNKKETSNNGESMQALFSDDEDDVYVAGRHSRPLYFAGCFIPYCFFIAF